MTASSQLLDSQVMSYTTFSVYIWAISVFRYNENIYIMRLDSVSAMHFLSLIKVCIQIVWCIAIRPWLLVPLKPLSNTVHHWMLSLPKENFLPSVFCSILFSRIKEGYQNSHNSRILKVLVWVTMTRGQQQQCPSYCGTICEDYQTNITSVFHFCRHRLLIQWTLSLCL